MTSRRFGLERVWQILACNSYKRRLDIGTPSVIRIIEYSNYFIRFRQPLNFSVSPYSMFLDFLEQGWYSTAQYEAPFLHRAVHYDYPAQERGVTGLGQDQEIE
jgi:hypothetical protein